ncbi:hypothetical protein ABL78_2231 [Leptomonas seymouri]|uniref:Dynein heavy chain linker domain-containing protein n=1 Tax=Leptomonas seymouri TaxID=5684 RepID=A0A0N1PDK1_LEPSE|nr:hypothetical protein ABL78_2231 [Leptomonas seymouri]|eukprot:KPI88693.1 hypothetical protein ABL78_2231 [Leptomonas seymouri]
MTDIFRASRQHMYCGRFEVSCVELQETLAQEWKNYMSTLISTYQKTIVNIVDSAKERSSTILKVFDTIPSNVEELEINLQNTEAAKSLAQELRYSDCKEIISRVACMEMLYIPIEQDVCRSVLDFMKLPDKLLLSVEKARDVRMRCAPLLRRKLNQLRTSTQDYMQTLSTGVTELYHLFNFETCDIAAQTCSELRELVDRIDTNLKQIAHEEEVLGVPAEDTFDNFPSLLHYFEVIEQFWNSIFDATKLRNMYNSPISSVNAVASVEKVREWRRLIHSSARHLRGFPLLVQLGREQEVALSKYEELGLFLEVVSSPNLRKNHWKDIAKLIAAQMREDIASVIDLSVTVRRLLDAGLMKHMGPLGQIANQAQCDYEVESALEEMRSYGKRTHFVFEDLHDSGESRTFVSKQFISDVFGHVEQFVIRCRAMRRYPNLGQLVQKPLLEWEFSCEKSCEMLAAFESIQESYMWVESFLQALQMMPREKGSGDSTRHAVIQHLSAASDAAKRLHTTMGKPQFSLYTAMVQDTIQDVFFVVKAAVDDVLELLRQNLHQRRYAFPRFHFLSDSQLLGFQFVLTPQSFVPLLPNLYSCLADVEVMDGDVTAVIAADGASLTLMNPVPLTAASSDAWMAQFDDTVRGSLLLGVKNCIAAYYRTDLEVWVSAWCGQIVLLALRIMHTESIRHAVQIGGGDALHAYARRISDLCCAFSQLALEANERKRRGLAGGSSVEVIIRAALAYEQFALQDVKLAIECEVRSVADLDCTQVVQTFFTPSRDSIRVSFMGVMLGYGMEFLGHGRSLFVSCSLRKQMVMVLADVELCRGVPLICGEGDVEAGEDVLKSATQMLGRFYLRVELTPQTLTETLIPLLQGCIETGVFLCLANCETISPKLLSNAVLPLIQAYRANFPSTRWELPFGAHGAVISISVHPFFRLAFSSASPATLPLQLSTLCDMVRIALPDLAVLMHCLLLQAGVIPVGPFSLEEMEVADLYKQLQERAPDIFTIVQLRVVIHDLIAHVDVASEDENASAIEPPLPSLPERFLISLIRTCCGAFQGDEGAMLYESLTEQIQSQLLLPSCKGIVPHGWSTTAFNGGARTTCEEGMPHFETLMEVHRRVLILGPRFSGKSELWKKWVGGMPSLILSPQLMTASDLYGSASQKGYLSRMTEQVSLLRPTTRTAPVVVLEDVDAPPSFQFFAKMWFDGRRISEGAAGGTGVVMSPKLRFIATAVEMRHVTPGLIDGYAMLALAGPSSWKDVIKWALVSMPEGEAAQRVLEVLLPSLVDRAAKTSPAIVGSAGELSNMCAIAQRAASLCCRWYAYAQTIRTHIDVLAPREDNDEVSLRLLAARCAVMAASWSVGLSLPPEDRDAVKLTLLSAEADVMKALAGIHLSGEVFPELTYSSISPLEQVVLPLGWMSFDDAAKWTDLPLSWADYNKINPQLPVSLQVFAMPSRITTLRSLECLINCGQHVLLHAAAANGKTTLLQTMRMCNNWVAQVFLMNAGFRATEMQQTMAGALSKRCNGRYGPLLGRRLVVCIDDLYLSPATAYGGGVPLAGCFMRHCEKFKAISTPVLGTVPVTDVVFCATTQLETVSHERDSIGALSGCVDVLLPSMNGDEIANGLLQICDTASSRKRAKEFPQGCALFLGLVHGAYCQLKQRCASLESISSLSLNLLSPVSRVALLDSNPLAVPSENEAQPADATTVALPSGSSIFLTENLRALLDAAEVVRLHLLSTVSDFQVSARVFMGVAAFYDGLLSPSANVLSTDTAAWPSEAAKEKEHQQVIHEFRDAVVQAAEGTLRSSIRGSVEFRDLARELPEVHLHDVVSNMDKSRVAQRIACFPDALDEEEEMDISLLGEQRKGSTGKRTHRSGTTVRSETRHASVLISYPDSLIVSAVRAEDTNKEMYGRRWSTAMGARSRSSSTSTVMSEVSTVAQRQSPSVVVTPIYQTTWLTTRFVHLADLLSAVGSHALLLGDNTFGMRRLFRLWCASSHVPFMLFRVDAAGAPDDVVRTFVAEFRTTIAYMCKHSVHTVAYVPPSLLRMPGVLRLIDAFVRRGDVSSLFSHEERFELLNGPNAAHSRSLKPFVFADDSELRRRVRGSMNFIFHLHDAAEVRRLGEGYPFLLQPSTKALPLYTERLEKSLLEEIALGILHDGDAYMSGIHEMECEDDAEDTDARDDSIHGDEYDKRLPPRLACKALCAIFNHVRKTHPTSVEQFMSFVRLYKELDGSARVQVIASARTGKIIASRGDAAVQAVNAATQRSRAIVEELAALQLKLSLLTDKLKEQEEEHAMRVVEAEQSQKALQRAGDAIQMQQGAIMKNLTDAKERVAKSLKQLRRAKSGAVRSLSMSRVPEKGTLLVRALYAVLDEDLPKHNDNASDLWSASMRQICTKRFIVGLTKVAPESNTDRISSLLPFQRALDMVRYAPALPYAQLLADFVVAWVDCVRFMAEDYTASMAEIVKARRHFEQDEANCRQQQEDVALAEKAMEQTRSESESVQNSLVTLQQEQSGLVGSEKRLLKYTGLVDRFTRFLVGPATVAERVKRAQCATGDTLLVAAFYTLLAMHDDAQSMSVALQKLLTETLNDTTLRFSPLHEACAPLLYQTHAPRAELLMATGCSALWQHKALLLSLYQRRASRWTLVGGADPVVEHELRKFLTFSCTNCITLSAVDPLTKERLAAAMRSGEGVLLRDVHSASTLDLVRSLNPVYQRLKGYHSSLRRSRWDNKDSTGGSAGGAATLQPPSNASKKLPMRPQKGLAAQPVMTVWFDGQEVRVHPKFFLVCTCWPVVTSALQEACASLDVFNLHIPLSHDARLEWHFYTVVAKPSVSAKIASMQEEMKPRQQMYFEVLHDFADAHDSAAALLAVDLHDISGSERSDALLAEMEQALTNVDTHEGQMSQITSYMQSLQRTVQEGWDMILPAVKAVAMATEQIETNRLGRPWNVSGLSGCIADISNLSPALLRRIAPLSFSDLPTGQKCYYALMHYLQRVVEFLAPGWPTALRGMFSLSILCTAVSAAPEVCAAEWRIPMLTEGQRSVLARMVYDCPAHETGEATGEATVDPERTLPSLWSEGVTTKDGGPLGFVRRLFATSGDALLRRLVSVGGDVVAEEMEGCFAAGGETTFDIMQLFGALLELRIEQASSHAFTLYNTFVNSVTDLSNSLDHSPTSLSMHASYTERPRSKSMTHRQSSSATEGELEGLTSYARVANEGGDSASPQIEEPTMDTQIQRAVKSHLPLCLVSEGHIEGALAWLQSEVKDTKWAFQWHELVSPASVPVLADTPCDEAADALQRRASLLQAFEKAMQEIILLARAPCKPDTCGMCLALVVDVKSDPSANAVAPSDVVLCREELQRLLSLYSTTSSMRTSSGAAPTLCLTVLCSVAAQKIIWGQVTADAPASQLTSYSICRGAETMPCCYPTLPTYTPQMALTDLLRPSRCFFTKDGVVQVCDYLLQQVQNELIARSGSKATPETRTTRVRGPALAKLNFSRGSAALSVPLPQLPPDLSSGALVALQRSVTNLRSSARLLQYEMTVAYVASTTRLHLRYALNKTMRGAGNGMPHNCTAEQRLSRPHLYNPFPLSRLNALLFAWVRQRYGELVAQLSGLRSTEASLDSETSSTVLQTTASAAVKTRLAQVPPSIRIPAHRDLAAEHLCGYGIQAYYYLRRSQPAWGLLLQKAERYFADTASSAGPPGSVEATADLLNPFLCSLMRATETRASDEENANAANRTAAFGADKAANSPPHARRRQQKGLVEDAGLQWRAGLFVLARKFALHYFCARYERMCAGAMDHSMLLLERQAHCDMLCSAIAPATDSEGVSFLWGPLTGEDYADGTKWQELRISLPHLDSFRSEVAGAPSDLMELCGEAGVIERCREARQRDLLQSCCSQAVCGSFAADLPTDSVDVDAAAGPEVHEPDSTRQETELALFALQDACEGACERIESVVTLAETMLEWDGDSIDACALKPTALNSHFKEMVQFFTYVVSRWTAPTVAAPEDSDTQYVRLWLPALRHPLFDLQYLTSPIQDSMPNLLARHGTAFQPRAQCPGRSGEDPFTNLPYLKGENRVFVGAERFGDIATALVVVVTEQRFLLPSDVVLSGARLSPSLLLQVRELAGWRRETSENDASTNAGVAKDRGAAEELVIAVRRVLLRQFKAKADDVSKVVDPKEALGENDRTQGISVEVGAYARSADPSSPRLIWSSAVCVQTTKEDSLWSPRPARCTRYTVSTSRSLSTALSSSLSPQMNRATKKLFVTEVDDGESHAALHIADIRRAVHVWNFSDVPIPIRWNSVHGDDELCMAELPLCVEYDELCQDGMSSLAFLARDEPADAEVATGDGRVLGGIFPLQGALDAYIWIAW